MQFLSKRNPRSARILETDETRFEGRAPLSGMGEKESAGERESRKQRKDLYPLLSHSRLLLETAFVEFSARMETKWRETDRPLGPLGSFSPFLFPQTSCCRIAPVHLRLDPRPGKKRGGPVDKGILGWDEVSGRPQLSVMIASSRGPF